MTNPGKPRSAGEAEHSVEPRYYTYAERKSQPTLPDDIRDLVLERHLAQRSEIGLTIGNIELAYRRGVFAGYAQGFEGAQEMAAQTAMGLTGVCNTVESSRGYSNACYDIANAIRNLKPKPRKT